MNSHNATSNRIDADQRRRHKVEVRLFKQTLFQNAIFIYAVTSYFCVCPLFHNKWAKYFTSTFLWELTPALDG
ncbi:hypothetical protein KIN20_013745 [Parelaphostrongylus tenuis]|uniref:7TM GPCR serpentine receptor class x (Srx) domain-containing protein n=1 Tax=Parelaphostrongylus tenuis TaxID=148309 RepID=A0AAD5MH50_PARTN|nr:hypothetical protein KIN20_013745 [Parelaphostrongylus tenuis]